MGLPVFRSRGSLTLSEVATGTCEVAQLLPTRTSSDWPWERTAENRSVLSGLDSLVLLIPNALLNYVHMYYCDHHAPRNTIGNNTMQPMMWTVVVKVHLKQLKV